MSTGTQEATKAARAEVPKQRRKRPQEFTERDGAALGWMGEQYGATLDVLGVLLGRLGGRSEPLSKWGVRNQVDRWQRAGLVRTERVLGDSWVTPTTQGLDRAGVNVTPWAVPVTRVRHSHAVNVVRLWYEGTGAAMRFPWVSERMTYLERGKGPTWHIPDGVIQDPRSADRADKPLDYIAVEVELTHKGRRAYDTEVFGNLRAGITRVHYFVPDQAFADRLGRDIRAVLENRGSETRYAIELLPEVPGVTYRGGR